MDRAENFVRIEAGANGLADVGEEFELFRAAMRLLQESCVSAVLARVKKEDGAEEHRRQGSEKQRDVLVKIHCTSQTEAATRGMSLAAKQGPSKWVFGLSNYSTSFVNRKKMQGFACAIGKPPVTSKEPYFP